MKYLRLFWGLLMTSSDHRDSDPTVEAGNQSGHMLWAGIIGATTICAVWFMVFGEMPDRVGVWMFVVMFYAVFIEAIKQGWRGSDSFKDSFFVMCGATITLIPFKEVGVSQEGMPILTFNPYLWALTICSIVVAFALHLYPRIKEYFRSKDAQ